jgi:hypothetical protein
MIQGVGSNKLSVFNVFYSEDTKGIEGEEDMPHNQHASQLTTLGLQIERFIWSPAFISTEIEMV